MMFGERVGKVVFSGPKVEEKLALANSVLKPVPAHVHGFGPLLFHGPVCEAIGSGVIDLDGGGCLGVSQLSKGCSDGDYVLTVQIASSNLGLGSGANNNVDDLTQSVDGAVERWNAGRGLIRSEGS